MLSKSNDIMHPIPYPELQQKILQVEFNCFWDIFIGISADQKEELGVKLVDGVYSAHLMRALPASFANVLLAQPSPQMIDALPALIDEITAHQDFFFLYTYADNKQINSFRQLSDFGFTIVGFGDYWIADLQSMKLKAHSSITLITEDTLSRYSEVIATAFGFEGSDGMDAMNRSTFSDDSTSMFGYKVDDEIVGVGMCYVNDEYVYLGGGAVLEDHRGKQIQQHLARARMEYGRQQGAKYALVATGVNTTSGRNMARVGFNKAMTSVMYKYTVPASE